MPGSMRVIIARALLPIAGYWSLLLALSVHTRDLEGSGLLLPLVVALGLPLVFLASITLFRAAHASGSQLALRDELTGVGNRLAFVKQSQALLHAARTATVGLILIDVDGLKQLNDSCGHQAGDELLSNVAGHIEGVVDIYRIGGDEFAILVDRTSGQHMSRLMNALEPFVAEFAACGHKHEVRVSFGSTSNREGEKFEDLFRRADDSLIQHKRHLYSQGWLRERRAGPANTEEDRAEPHQERRLRILG